MFEGNNGRGLAPGEHPPPDVTERYETASSTSDMTIGGGMVPKDHRSGAADIIGAAGMSDSRMGMALMRLQSEWHGAAKPRPLRPDQIKRIAMTMLTDKGKPDMRRATIEAARWHASELVLLAQSLKSRASVLEQLHTWANLKGIKPEVIGPALHHWLDSTCRNCSGHGFYKEKDLPSLSARRCTVCHGTGAVERPEGSTRVLNYLDDALQKGRESLKKRLTYR